MPTTLYLIRHATPDWSRTEIRYDIPPGPPLTAQGEAEATKLGDFLRAVGVQKLYASPLERTKRTAQLAAQVANLPVLETYAIAEWQRGESEGAVLERFLPFWAAAWGESNQIGPVALITHGGPIRTMLQHLKLAQAEIDHYRKQFDRDNPLPPTGAWRVTRGNGTSPWQMQLAYTPNPYRVYEPPVVYV